MFFLLPDFFIISVFLLGSEVFDFFHGFLCFRWFSQRFLLSFFECLNFNEEFLKLLWQNIFFSLKTRRSETNKTDVVCKKKR